MWKVLVLDSTSVQFSHFQNRRENVIFCLFFSDEIMSPFLVHSKIPISISIYTKMGRREEKKNYLTWENEGKFNRKKENKKKKKRTKKNEEAKEKKNPVASAFLHTQVHIIKAKQKHHPIQVCHFLAFGSSLSSRCRCRRWFEFHFIVYRVPA